MLFAYYFVCCQPGYFCQGYAPIVDGPGGFMPDIPLRLRETMSPSRYVPIISGICRDDGSLYTAFCEQLLVPLFKVNMLQEGNQSTYIATATDTIYCALVYSGHSTGLLIKTCRIRLRVSSQPTISANYTFCLLRCCQIYCVI